MTTFTKTLIAPAAAIALGLSFSAPVAAGEQEDILVTSKAAMEEWSSGVSRDLDRKLIIAERFRKQPVTSGIVQIRFRLDENGRPTKMETYHNSANLGAERTAQWAVSRLRNLDEVPVTGGRGALFQANVIFADTDEERQYYVARLERMERSRLASASGETVINLGS